jgi:hypothetical protein
MKTWVIVFTLGGDPETLSVKAFDVIQAIQSSGLPQESIICVTGIMFNG